MAKPIHILFFSDTHLGFDLPLRPRIARRRRGDDFYANYQSLLDLAVGQKVDLIVHGGDVFFRSRVPPSIVDRALEPLLVAADAGIPIYLVPGNHERSRLPPHLWWAHPNLHIFNEPKTYIQRAGGVTIALSGFPFARRVKEKFHVLLQQTGFEDIQADIHYLCLHQTFEGARVGPKDFTFRTSPDNVPPMEIPDRFAAVLSGHIHRAQLLTLSLDRQSLPVPVIYPGSIERTAFAERFEEKFYVLIQLIPKGESLDQVIQFHRLPSRPMALIEISAGERSLEEIKTIIQSKLSAIDPHAVVRLHLLGPNAEEIQQSLSASSLRALAPQSMNISLGNRIRPRRERRLASH